MDSRILTKSPPPHVGSKNFSREAGPAGLSSRLSKKAKQSCRMPQSTGALQMEKSMQLTKTLHTPESIHQ